MAKRLLTTLTLIGALAIGGCAANRNFHLANSHLEDDYTALSGRYIAAKSAVPILETIVGIYNGSIQLGMERKDYGRKVKEFLTKGKYKPNKNTQLIDEVAYNADADQNKIIEFWEARMLQIKVYKLLTDPFLKK